MITPALAAKAYASIQQAQGLEDPAAAAAAGPQGANFADVLKGVMGDTIQSSRSAESQIMAGLQGKADLVDVVTAISSAQASLQTVMAVRDQVLSAYQEIMRMQI